MKTYLIPTRQDAIPQYNNNLDQQFHAMLGISNKHLRIFQPVYLTAVHNRRKFLGKTPDSEAGGDEMWIKNSFSRHSHDFLPSSWSFTILLQHLFASLSLDCAMYIFHKKEK